jgi:hypothetical protein
VQEELTQVEVDNILDGFSVESVILGHTKDNNIRSLYEGRVIAIDMYHVNNFNNGFMKALQYELGCFFTFLTNASGETYTQLDSECEQVLGTILNINGDNQLIVYPNPTSNTLNIKIPKDLQGEYSYKIYSMDGKQVSQGRLNKELSIISINSRAAGKYILVIENSIRIIKGSFIIK